jgi:hypothetical protein
MKKNIVVHVNGEYTPAVIQAMEKAGYRLQTVEQVNGFIHLEFKKTKKQRRSHD